MKFIKHLLLYKGTRRNTLLSMQNQIILNKLKIFNELVRIQTLPRLTVTFETSI